MRDIFLLSACSYNGVHPTLLQENWAKNGKKTAGMVTIPAAILDYRLDIRSRQTFLVEPVPEFQPEVLLRTDYQK